MRTRPIRAFTWSAECLLVYKRCGWLAHPFLSNWADALSRDALNQKIPVE